MLLRTLLIIAFSALTVFAQPYSVSFNSFDGTTFDPLTILRSGTAIPIGSLIQVIKTGQNNAIDPCNPTTGEVAGDDILAYSTCIGEGTLTAGTFSFSVTCYTTAERPNPSFPSPTERVYIRIWTSDSTLPTATPVPPMSYYCETPLYTIPTYFADFFDIRPRPSNTNPTWLGPINSTGVREEETGVITQYTLSNYPNPFNPSTTIRLNQAGAGPAQLDVVNLLGQRVATLYNSHNLPAGNHTFKWNAEALPSGTYFIRYETGNQRQMRAMQLAK